MGVKGIYQADVVVRGLSNWERNQGWDEDLTVHYLGSGEVECIEDRCSGGDNSAWLADEADVKFVKDKSADIFWKGCTTSENAKRWERSKNAVEFGNRAGFCYVSRNARNDRITFRFYREDGSNVAIQAVQSQVQASGAYDWNVVAYDNLFGEDADGNKVALKGRFLWKRNVTGYKDLGYDDSYEGAAERLMIRLVTLFGAKVQYGLV